jgi:NAD(P)H-hydrate repair Nnr-like enzyme with NAD(P)H-hydrate epimerase domain
MVLVLVVQVGVWLLVVGSGRSGGDGVGSVASFLFGFLTFNIHFKLQVSVMLW